MISVAEAPKYLTVCASCQRENPPTWAINFKTIQNDKTSQGTTVVLCTKCCLVLAVKIYNATKEEMDANAQ